MKFRVILSLLALASGIGTLLPQSLVGDWSSLSIPNLMMSYSGCVKDNLLTGSFQQRGIKLPLVLEPGTKKANRPQTPIPPFPYKEENVKIDNASENVVLAGTLTIPENYTATTPIVVLDSGSGAQNRTTITTFYYFELHL